MQRHSRAQVRASRERAIAKAKRTARTREDQAWGSWGRYAKRHLLDCGRTRCGLCHWGKRFGRQRTVQERRAEDDAAWGD